MTLDDAQKVARIIGTADHGCSTCVSKLIDKMNAAFPEFDFVDTGREECETVEGDEPDDPTGERFVVIDVKQKE